MPKRPGSAAKPCGLGVGVAGLLLGFVAASKPAGSARKDCQSLLAYYHEKATAWQTLPLICRKSFASLWGHHGRFPLPVCRVQPGCLLLVLAALEMVICCEGQDRFGPAHGTLPRLKTKGYLCLSFHDSGLPPQPDAPLYLPCPFQCEKRQVGIVTLARPDRSALDLSGLFLVRRRPKGEFCQTSGVEARPPRSSTCAAKGLTRRIRKFRKSSEFDPMSVSPRTCQPMSGCREGGVAYGLGARVMIMGTIDERGHDFASWERDESRPMTMICQNRPSDQWEIGRMADAGLQHSC